MKRPTSQPRGGEVEPPPATEQADVRPRRVRAKPANVPAPPRKATPASWRPGQSGNPQGRPRSPLSLAERVREKVSPDELIDIALELARKGAAESTRIAALAWLSDRGWAKPATQQNHLVARVGAVVPTRWALMSPEQRAAYLDARLMGSGDAIDVDPGEDTDHE